MGNLIGKVEPKTKKSRNGIFDKNQFHITTNCPQKYDCLINLCRSTEYATPFMTLSAGIPNKSKIIMNIHNGRSDYIDHSKKKDVIDEM